MDLTMMNEKIKFMLQQRTHLDQKPIVIED